MAKYIIAYDICHPKRLRRVARILERHALRIQKSVFLFQGTEESLHNVIELIRCEIDHESDIVQAWLVPAVDRWVIALCNQNRIAPDHFIVGEKGVRLKKEIFSDIVANWEEFWYKNGCFDQLLRFIQHFSKSVRAAR
jgi:CRISPR-associated endoribonuclease Cas2